MLIAFWTQCNLLVSITFHCNNYRDLNLHYAKSHFWWWFCTCHNHLIWYLLDSEQSFILLFFRILQLEFLIQQRIKNIVSFHEVFEVQCNCPYTVYIICKCAVSFNIFNALFFVLTLSNCCYCILFSASFALQNFSIALIKGIGLF